MTSGNQTHTGRTQELRRMGTSRSHENRNGPNLGRGVRSRQQRQLRMGSSQSRLRRFRRIRRHTQPIPGEQMNIHHHDETTKVIHGDCIETMNQMEPESISAIVTDPPYGLGFMGRKWDDLPPSQEWAEACYRVLKPGGHIAAFGGTRTWHRLAVAIEDAGFEMRDSLAWLYGTGFPKSHSVSKDIDRTLGAERPKSKEIPTGKGASAWSVEHGGRAAHRIATAKADGVKTVKVANDDPITPEAAQWDGWGTALKPAFEPIVLARKPLAEKTVARNVLAHGTGAINVDACRIETPDGLPAYSYPNGPGGNTFTVGGAPDGTRAAPVAGNPSGRWPANVLLDHHAAAWVDEQSGDQKDGVAVKRNGGGRRIGSGLIYSNYTDGKSAPDIGYGGSGGASRFF